MPLDRSTRTLVAALLWVAAAFIIMNNIIGASALDDWLLPLLFIVVGALVYFLPERVPTRGAATDSPDTQERSDSLASVSVVSPVRDELHDPIENIGTSLTLSMEEVGEISEPPRESTFRNPIVPPVPTPSIRSTQTTPSVAPPAEQPKTTVTQGDTESIDTQERSDALAATSAGSHAPSEMQDPVENMLTSPSHLRETDEVASAPADSISHTPVQIDIPRSKPVQAASDDLTIVEGIGPKMSAALVAAGIGTFARLAEANEEDLRNAIAAAGMRFSPSLPTWSEQAAYAARGDWDGLRAFQKTLSSGRKTT